MANSPSAAGSRNCTSGSRSPGDALVPVAVGYIAFAAPATLEGHLFNFVGEPNRYGLDQLYQRQVWTRWTNPAGAFTDNDPDVSCAATPADAGWSYAGTPGANAGRRVRDRWLVGRRPWRYITPMTPTPPLWTHARLSVAPMMDWTDRHCRFLHRLISRQALLYSEMVTAQAIVHGPRDRLLGFDPAEQPVALQLGGSEPALLAEAVRIAAPYGYGEMNLNVGCPSDRVKSGCFGAVLMKQPALVADCVAAMIAASPVEVTVKCRIGIDDQEPRDVLPAFIETIAGAGARRIAIHARKAWLQGLSPKENREIPPLDYPLVLEMKRAFPDLHISVNGGIVSLAQAKDFLDRGLDGVMVGRAAYHEPWGTLARADAEVFGGGETPDPWEIADRMRPYIARHLSEGGRLHQISRHMLGLFHGRPGARHWRRVLSERANADGAGPEVVDAALAAMDTAQAA